MKQPTETNKKPQFDKYRFPRLVRSVYNQLGADNYQEFIEELKNVQNCYVGAAGGFSGFIYYNETCSFYRKNRALILELLEEYEYSTGFNSIDTVHNFNCLQACKNKPLYSKSEISRALYGRYNQELTIIYNALAWFALEETAYNVLSFEEEPA